MYVAVPFIDDADVVERDAVMLVVSVATMDVTADYEPRTHTLDPQKS